MVFAEISSDPAAGVGFFAALAAGIVSFLSPCVLPLVPGYLSAVTGVSATELENANWRRVLGPSLLFVASFSVIFILLGTDWKAGAGRAATGASFRKSLRLITLGLYHNCVSLRNGRSKGFVMMVKSRP